MKTVKLIAVGISFPIAEALAKQFELKCFHRELGFKMDGWYVTDDEIVFDMKGYAKAKAGSFPCPITDGPYRAVSSAGVGIVGIDKMISTIQMGIKKPEIGLMPERIWQEQRIKSINEAIQRYSQENQIIPAEWVKERNELLKKLCTL